MITETYELPGAGRSAERVPARALPRQGDAGHRRASGRRVKTLLHIKQWSFHWQQDYRYATPIPLPARHAADDAVHVRQLGRRTATTRRRRPCACGSGRKSDGRDGGSRPAGAAEDGGRRAAAGRVVRRTVPARYLALGESRVREEPNNAEYRAFLGGQYVEGGRFAERDAAPRGRRPAAIRESAAAHNDLGTALMEPGRLPEALAALRRAAALEPRNELMHFNLGNALREVVAARRRRSRRTRRRCRSIRIFRTRTSTWARCSSRRGRIKDALPHFERAVELQPNSAVLHNNLGRRARRVGRYVDAMQHVRRALAIEARLRAGDRQLTSVCSRWGSGRALPRLRSAGHRRFRSSPRRRGCRLRP